MATKRVLFVCIHNSARSQMAMTYLNALGKDLDFEAESAGIEPGVLNPLAVEAMRLDGYDISKTPPTVSLIFINKAKRIVML